MAVRHFWLERTPEQLQALMNLTSERNRRDITHTLNAMTDRKGNPKPGHEQRVPILRAALARLDQIKPTTFKTAQ